jgi:hypothetical protein
LQERIITSGQFVERKLLLGSSFKCDQIHKRYEFWSHFDVLLKSGLDVEQTSKQVVGLMNKSLSSDAVLGVTKLITINTMNDPVHSVLCCLSLTCMFNNPTSETGLLNGQARHEQHTKV